MLGAVADAEVTLIGTSGELGTGQTDTEGHFGPIGYPASYDGPLRIEVSGNGTSTWSCDYLPGCLIDGNRYSAGESIEFDGTLAAVLPDSTDGQYVSVSLLSDMVSRRAELLGGLTAANIDSASADIAALLRTILADVIDVPALAIPDDFTAFELFDSARPPAPGGSDDAVAAVLSLLNSSLPGLADGTQTTGELIDAVSQTIAEQPDLPVSAAESADPSRESLIFNLMAQLDGIRSAANPYLRDAFDQWFSPADVDELYESLLDQVTALPALIVSAPTYPYLESVDDATLQKPITRSFEVTTSTGDPLTLDDYGVRVLNPGHETLDEPWLSATPKLVNGVPYVRIDFDKARIAMLGNGIYEAAVDTYSRTGDYARDRLPIFLNVDLFEKTVEAGVDFDAEERAVVTLSGSTSSPSVVESIHWAQVDGPATSISGADTFQPDVTLPSVAADADVTLRLDVEFTSGELRSDSIAISVLAFPNISDQHLADPALQQCVNEAASDGNLVETQELSMLDCSGVGSIDGLAPFTGLTSLVLQSNGLESLADLLALDNLEYLDISGASGLPCADIDALAERLEEGVAFIVDDICTAAVNIDLGAPGFDSALDEARGRIYVSLPARNEIAVISTTDLHVVDRIALAGSPYGIDLGIDGTRLFAALHGSTAVAVIDPDDGSVSTIPLDDATGHAATWDVVEGAPDRLIVSASPGSGGFSYIAQVRLDQGNLLSRVADNRIIRAQPMLARSPDGDFLYVGENFSPNSLYKLSLLDPDAPILLEDDHGSVGGTDNLVLNGAGTRIALSSGQILRTGSFIEEGQVSPGRSTAGTAGDTLFVASAGGKVEAFDFASLQLLDSTATGCDNGTTSRLHVYDGDQSFMLLQAQTACVYTRVSRSMPADPFAALRFPDLGFEQCVIDAATSAGFTKPEDFVTLDCSMTGARIRNIEGIGRLVNLEHLDLSDSDVFDLSPVSSLPALQSLVITDAKIGDLSPLSDVAALSLANLTGNPAVPCAGLDELALRGATVQADACAETTRIELGGIGADLALDSAGDRAFVSVPSIEQIIEIDLGAGSVVQTFPVGGQPQGIDLGADNQTLYAAIHGDGDTAVLDTENGALEVVDLSAELNDEAAWDIAEVSTDRFVVSANPGSGGLSYIVEVRRDFGNAATRVADTRIIRAAPVFAVSPDEQAVFVGEGFSPNSLYKLDAGQADLPLVLEDEHGQIGGTDHLALSPDGSRIYLSSGQVLDTETFIQVAQYGQGRSVVSSDGTRLLVGDTDAGAARVYDSTSTEQTGVLNWGCDISNLTTLDAYGSGILALGDDLVCYTRTVSYP